MSTPAVKASVANVCLATWNENFFSIPASVAQSRSMLLYQILNLGNTRSSEEASPCSGIHFRAFMFNGKYNNAPVLYWRISTCHLFPFLLICLVHKVTTKKRNAERYSDRIELQGFQSCFRLFVKPSQSPLKPNQDAATLLVRNHARNGDKRTRITKQGVKD